MSTETKTTPAPWYFEADRGIKGHWTIWADVDGTKTFVADCYDGPEAKADAALIVRAVNALEATERLVEELEKALRALLAVAEMTTFSDQYPGECEAANAALDSIADWRKP